MENNNFCVVITTYSDEKVGKSIIGSLIENKLAACIQVQNIESYYHWKGEVNCDNEKLLYIKTKKSLYKDVEQKILENHDYETPEIILLPIERGFKDYLNWINEECI